MKTELIVIGGYLKIFCINSWSAWKLIAHTMCTNKSIINIWPVFRWHHVRKFINRGKISFDLLYYTSVMSYCFSCNSNSQLQVHTNSNDYLGSEIVKKKSEISRVQLKNVIAKDNISISENFLKMIFGQNKCKIKNAYDILKWDSYNATDSIFKNKSKNYSSLSRKYLL